MAKETWATRKGEVPRKLTPGEDNVARAVRAGYDVHSVEPGVKKVKGSRKDQRATKKAEKAKDDKKKGK